MCDFDRSSVGFYSWFLPSLIGNSCKFLLKFAHPALQCFYNKSSLTDSINQNNCCLPNIVFHEISLAPLVPGLLCVHILPGLAPACDWGLPPPPSPLQWRVLSVCVCRSVTRRVTPCNIRDTQRYCYSINYHTLSVSSSHRSLGIVTTVSPLTITTQHYSSLLLRLTRYWSRKN